MPATIRTSAQYYPTLQVSLTLEGERYTEQEKEELNADLTRKTDLLRAGQAGDGDAPHAGRGRVQAA